MAFSNLNWQSKAVLLLVVPYTALALVFHLQEWIRAPYVVIWVIGLSAALGMLAWVTRAGTFAATLVGALLTADVMFSTAIYPYDPWKTGLLPVLALLLLTSFATRVGRARKEQLGTAEKRRGRVAAQVSANVGVAALACDPTIQTWMLDNFNFHSAPSGTLPLFVVALAAMAEASADTVSSEIGQVLGGEPRLITTLRRVAPGTDGGITLAGTSAGVLAAGIVAAVGTLALHGGMTMFTLAWIGGVFGLFFDSLLGATLERHGALNNDAVNFLSTVSAAAFALFVLVVLHVTGG